MPEETRRHYIDNSFRNRRIEELTEEQNRIIAEIASKRADEELRSQAARTIDTPTIDTPTIKTPAEITRVEEDTLAPGPIEPSLEELTELESVNQSFSADEELTPPQGSLIPENTFEKIAQRAHFLLSEVNEIGSLLQKIRPVYKPYESFFNGVEEALTKEFKLLEKIAQKDFRNTQRAQEILEKTEQIFADIKNTLTTRFKI